MAARTVLLVPARKWSDSLLVSDFSAELFLKLFDVNHRRKFIFDFHIGISLH